ncbi:MAG TPA: SurA N-terminal domain-containing protein, partial [Novimethylophilus sp.]|uniref:SurA N-terminal domain-containing protein n=1 Tax=Novimethylophilus sp. TaxID=2137426 RepID=UPI002F42D54E
MLEAIRERSQSWIAKLILAMITVPFALWGVDSYLRQAGSNVAVAKVNGESVTVQQFSKSLQELRDSMKEKADAGFMENPEVRSAVLDKLINARLLAAEVRRGGYAISDEQLSKTIITMPEFQKDGQFSQDAYDKILAANGLTPSRFEAVMRGDLLTQQVRNSISRLAFAPHAVADNALRVQHQLREVSVYSFRPGDFLSQAKVESAELKAYYDKHQDEFRVPEQVKLDFAVLSANSLIASMQISDAEAKKFYDDNAAKFQGDEERRASHILIAFGAGKDEAAKAAAKKKAQEVWAEAKKSPEKFAVLAKKYSQDPGSAANGGDLGPIKRGLMVKPFEDTVFGMAPGSISDPVETEFGYHIIKLMEVKGAAQSFDQVRGQIRAELMYQKALAKFAEAAESFSNTVYEQSASLEPAAKEHNLQIQKSDWMSREDAAKFFKNDKLAGQIFSDEVRKEKRNTEAVEVTPNTLVAARVAEARAASMKSFDEVKAGIEDKLKHVQAARLAMQQGEKVLADLKKGGTAASVGWTT